MKAIGICCLFLTIFFFNFKTTTCPSVSFGTSLSTTKSEFKVGEPIQVVWKNASAHQFDQIAIYPKDTTTSLTSTAVKITDK